MPICCARSGKLRGWLLFPRTRYHSNAAYQYLPPPNLVRTRPVAILRRPTCLGRVGLPFPVAGRNSHAADCRFASADVIPPHPVFISGRGTYFGRGRLLFPVAGCAPGASKQHFTLLVCAPLSPIPLPLVHSQIASIVTTMVRDSGLNRNHGSPS